MALNIHYAICLVIIVLVICSKKCQSFMWFKPLCRLSLAQLVCAMGFTRKSYACYLTATILMICVTYKAYKESDANWTTVNGVSNF